MTVLSWRLILLVFVLRVGHIHGADYATNNQSSRTRNLCANDTVNITPDCWDLLDVSSFLQDWWRDNQASCASSPYTGSGFASCFQQKHKVLNQQCEEIGLSNCYPPPSAEGHTIQEYYVLYSIFGLWAWYSSIWVASAVSTLLADLPVGQIIQTINPVVPSATSPGVLLSALSAGFAFLAVPGGNTAAKLIATSVGQAPGLTKALLPSGSLASELKQISEIERALGGILEQFQRNLANALLTVQNDFDAFSGFVANGSFIAEQPSLNASTGSITKTLKTFVVSQALQANNIIITVARGLSASAISQNVVSPSDFPVLPDHSYAPPAGTISKQNAGHVNCPDFSGQSGLCGNWWVDSATKDWYALYKLDDIEKDYGDLLESIFTQGWTTPEDLFIGASQRQHQWTSSIYDFITPAYPSIQVNRDSIQTSCFSNIRVCTWNQTNDPSKKDGFEFETGTGCAFAWPNICFNDLPYNYSKEGQGLSLLSAANSWGAFIAFGGSDLKQYLCSDPNSGTGPSIVYRFYDDVCPGFLAARVLNGELLAFNSLYDMINNEYDALNNQAKQVGSTQCQVYPYGRDDADKRPGWGGAGYPQDLGSECDKYPASYLGPGIRTNSRFCQKLRD